MRPIPDSYYTGIGRVTVAAATLEMYIAEVASAALGLPAARHFGDLAGRPGRAMRKLREAASARPDLVELPGLHDAARLLFDERNKYVHGVLVVKATPGGAPDLFRWSRILQRPSDGSSHPLATTEDLADLTFRLEALAGEVSSVWGVLIGEQNAADSVRTEEVR